MNFAISFDDKDENGMVVLSLLADPKIMEGLKLLTDPRIMEGLMTMTKPRGPVTDQPSLEGKVIPLRGIGEMTKRKKRDAPYHGPLDSMIETYKSLAKHSPCHWSTVGRDIENLGFKATTANANLSRMAKTGHSIMVKSGTYALGKAPPETLPKSYGKLA
jgi:hypothetical protein